MFISVINMFNVRLSYFKKVIMTFEYHFAIMAFSNESAEYLEVSRSSTKIKKRKT